jgi:two-component system, NarL family, sensor histidine kinase DesK
MSETPGQPGTPRSQQPPGLPQSTPARPILLAVITAYATLGMLDIALSHPALADEIPMLVCMPGVYALQLVHSSAATEQWSARRKALSLAAQAALIYLPFLAFHQVWGGMAGFLSGSFLLLLRNRAAWIGFAVTVGAQPVIEYFAYHDSLEWAAYYLAGTLVTGLFTYGMTRLTELIAELFAVRQELARLAVTRERLRFARDLHDLLGYSLSAITLRSELTKRLIPDQPDRARGELDEILDVSRKALADVRAVARGYRQLSLADEAASARTVLEAAGIRTTTDIRHLDQLPTTLDTTFATTLREGITNILRHSRAQNCTIKISTTQGTATLELTNDGANPTDTHTQHGSGLDNLTARLTDIEGTITTETQPHTNTFRLTAQAPLTPTPARAGPVRLPRGDSAAALQNE